jgi:hypothetical protein
MKPFDRVDDEGKNGSGDPYSEAPPVRGAIKAPMIGAAIGLEVVVVAQETSKLREEGETG